MEFFTISLLNGVSYGLLLFMLSLGAHADLQHDGRAQLRARQLLHAGRLLRLQIAQLIGFWPALVVAPLLVGVLGALFERYGLRRVHKFGHVPELLFTFGLSFSSWSWCS